MTQFELQLNGASVTVVGEEDDVLLWVLREQCGVNSVRYGCGIEACGACRVLLDDRLVFACNTRMADCHNRRVQTLEGIGGVDEHPLQTAVLELNAGQCGYCLSGILVTASKLLADNPQPSRSDIQTALDAHLCRCGAHNRIIQAIAQAAGSD